MPIRSTGLPEWFSLEKYASLSDASLEDWLIELSNRVHAFEALRRRQREETVSPRWHAEAVYTWDRIKHDGTLTGKSRRAMHRLRGNLGELFARSREEELLTQQHVSVRRVTKGDVVGRFFIADDVDSIKAEVDEASRPDPWVLAPGVLSEEGEGKIPWSFPMDVIGRSVDDFQRMLLIDLQAPDELILREFGEWLSTQRSVQAAEGRRTPKGFGKKDFDAWIGFQVLPFVDLRFACELGECTLTQPAIGAALFPDNYDVSLAERVRKGVVPRAEMLMSWRFLTAMERQVEAEKKRTSG